MTVPTRHLWLCSIAAAGFACQTTDADSPTTPESVDTATGTHIVLLGTGTPNADPERSGPSTAILVNGRPYIVDAGPGLVRRAAAAVEKGATGLESPNLDLAFITHLHSDHTVGLPDLIFTTWVLERDHPLALFGPPGTSEMARHLEAAYSADIQHRLSSLEPATPDGYRVDATDVSGGLAYEDDQVRVTAIPVRHSNWEHSLAYRFDTPDRSIVISGDAIPNESIVEACDGCDVLIHEVYSAAALELRVPVWQRYHRSSHTSGTELGDIANRARPGLLVLYHQLMWTATPDELIAEIRAGGYDGPIHFGRDLDIL